jgi:hypothetical protein
MSRSRAPTSNVSRSTTARPWLGTPGVERRRHPSCEHARQALCRIAARTVARSIPYPRGRSGHDLGQAAAEMHSGHELREAAEVFDAIADWSLSFRYPSPVKLLPESNAWTRFASRSQRWLLRRPSDSYYPIRPGQHRLEQHLAAGLGFLGLDALRLVVRKAVLAWGKNHRRRNVPRHVDRVVSGTGDDVPG